MAERQIFSVSVSDLQNKYKDRCKIKLDIFEKILEKCYYRIKSCADGNDTFCLFPVPEFILGEATYDLAYCAAFIIYRLKRNGYYARFYNPNLIYIQWSWEKPPFQNYNQSKLLENTEFPTKLLENKPKPIYRTVSDYKPMGSFLYN